MKSPERGPAERWAIALAAPISVRQHFPLDLLGGGLAPTGRGDSHARSLLRDLTAIDSRASAIETITQAFGGGGLLAIYAKKKKWLEALPAEAQAMGFVVLDNAEHLGRAFVLDHAGREEETSVVAWDTARAAYYAGLAYRAGYLAEHEAWAFLVRAAELARAAYGSWAEYGRAFVYGRWFWAGHFNADMVTAEKAIADLVSDPSSPWSTLPWDLDLAPLAALSRDPGDPGGPLRAIGVRVSLDCPECVRSILLPSPLPGVTCRVCRASLDDAAVSAWTTAVMRHDRESEEDEDSDEEERPIVGQTRDGLALMTNLGDDVIRVAFVAAPATCACGAPIADEAIRAAVGGAVACACGASIPVNVAPAAMRTSLFRARYVLGGPLLVGKPEGLVTILFSEG